jgi:hypothetical protein
LPGLDAARAELLFQDARRWGNICSLLNLLESVSREFFHFEQFFPMSEVTVAIPVIHNPVREIFGDSWKLSQFFDGRGVDIHGGIHIGNLDVRSVGEVLHTSRADDCSPGAMGKRTGHGGIKVAAKLKRAQFRVGRYKRECDL